MKGNDALHLFSAEHAYEMRKMISPHISKMFQVNNLLKNIKLL